MYFRKEIIFGLENTYHLKFFFTFFKKVEIVKNENRLCQQVASVKYRNVSLLMILGSFRISPFHYCHHLQCKKRIISESRMAYLQTFEG